MSTIPVGQLSPRAAWAFLAVGVALLAAASAAPPAAATGTLVIVALGSIAAIVTGYRRQASVPRPWQLMAAACGLFLIGVVLRALLPAPAPLPVQLVPNAFSLFGYLFLAAGLLGMLRLRRDADSSMRLDAILVGLASGLVAWTFLISPTLAPDHAGPPVLQVLDTAFPAMDVLLTGIVAQLVFSTRGTRSPALWLLAATMVAIFAGDLLYALHVAGAVSAAALGASDLLFLVAYVTLGAAALHPSMRALSEIAPDRTERFTTGRLTLLAVASLLAPLVLTVQGLTTPASIDWAAIAVSSVVLFLLVLARMAGLIARVQDQAAQLRALAHNDALTGIPNRRAWDLELSREMAKAVRSGDPVAVALIDIDHFKRFNDTHGHPAGDRLLKEAAAAWRDQLRTADLLARYGGEEFGVVLVGQSLETAIAVLDRMRSVTPNGQSFSAGVALWDGREIPEQLVARADEALYRSKHEGRNRVTAAASTTTAQAGARAHVS